MIVGFIVPSMVVAIRSVSGLGSGPVLLLFCLVLFACDDTQIWRLLWQSKLWGMHQMLVRPLSSTLQEFAGSVGDLKTCWLVLSWSISKLEGYRYRRQWSACQRGWKQKITIKRVVVDQFKRNSFAVCASIRFFFPVQRLIALARSFIMPVSQLYIIKFN